MTSCRLSSDTEGLYGPTGIRQCDSERRQMAKHEARWPVSRHPPRFVCSSERPPVSTALSGSSSNSTSFLCVVIDSISEQ